MNTLYPVQLPRSCIYVGPDTSYSVVFLSLTGQMLRYHLKIP